MSRCSTYLLEIGPRCQPPLPRHSLRTLASSHSRAISACCAACAAPAASPPASPPLRAAAAAAAVSRLMSRTTPFKSVAASRRARRRGSRADTAAAVLAGTSAKASDRLQEWEGRERRWGVGRGEPGPSPPGPSPPTHGARAGPRAGQPMPACRTHCTHSSWSATCDCSSACSCPFSVSASLSKRVPALYAASAAAPAAAAPTASLPTMRAAAHHMVARDYAQAEQGGGGRCSAQAVAVTGGDCQRAVACTRRPRRLSHVPRSFGRCPLC